MKVARAFCLFEQSGVFKDAFKEFGIHAEDYDIQNEYGRTDHIVDLFAEIEGAYNGEPSLFDEMHAEDLVLAFFPCIYFCCLSQVACTYNWNNYKNLSIREKTDAIIKRQKNRERYMELLEKLFCIALERGLRLVFENPWNEQTYLKANFVLPPSIVDMNRRMRGDYFVKPTAFWFVGCEPTHGATFATASEMKAVLDAAPSMTAGMCSAERSECSPLYARNFIADFILGKPVDGTQGDLFAVGE